MGIEFPQVIALAMQIGNARDLLGGHGSHHRESESKRRQEPLTLSKAKLFASLIEHGGIQDGLELVGHHGRLLAIHPKLLCEAKGC
jgi:hypothetical protein